MVSQRSSRRNVIKYAGGTLFASSAIGTAVGQEALVESVNVEVVQGFFGNDNAQVEISPADSRISADVELLADGQPTGSTARIVTGPNGRGTVQLGPLDANAENEVEVTAQDAAGNEEVIVETVEGSSSDDDSDNGSDPGFGDPFDGLFSF